VVALKNRDSRLVACLGYATSVVDVTVPEPPPVSQDSRGIIDPALLRERLTLNRYPPGPALEGLVDRFWVVSWRLPEGMVHTQQVLTHPCANLSVSPVELQEDGRPGPIEAVLNGVARQLTSRRLAGTGWALAPKTTPGGLGAFIKGPAAELTDRVVPLGPALGLDAQALIDQLTAANDEPDRVAVLTARLAEVVAAADPERVLAAREVAAVAKQAETDRSLRRLDDLAAASGIGARTLQRMFTEHAGVSPTWVLRRYRLLEAAETVRDGRPVVWAQVAADLGYSDQAHLVRDFRAAVGTTPAAYAAQQYGL
jgi:AraC-like DNA-binding protein